MSTTVVRYKLAPWARPALDTIHYLLDNDHASDNWLEYDRGQITNLVGGILVRLNPYKAPEQMEPNIVQIADWLYEELHK